MSNQTKAPSARISHTARIMLMLAVILILSSCARLNSIHRESDFGKNARIISVDAKQRFLVGMDTDINSKTLKRLCAEPSPDVFSAFAASLSGEAKFKAFEAALNASSSENAATIGIRTQAIQLLRDGMYRICEGLMNGDLVKKDFLDLHRRYQRIMVTLVAIEQLTGAVRPPSVAIQTSALAGRPARLNELQSSLEDARKNTTELKKKLEEQGETKLTDETGENALTCGNPGEGKDISSDDNCAVYLDTVANHKASNENVKNLEEEIKKARSEMVNSASGTVTLVANTGTDFMLDSESVKEISTTVKSMVASMFRLDPDTAIEKYAESECPLVFRTDSKLNKIKNLKIDNLNSIKSSFNSVGEQEIIKSQSDENDVEFLSNQLKNLYLNEYFQMKNESAPSDTNLKEQEFKKDFAICDALIRSINDQVVIQK